LGDNALLEKPGKRQLAQFVENDESIMPVAGNPGKMGVSPIFATISPVPVLTVVPGDMVAEKNHGFPVLPDPVPCRWIPGSGCG
jgi:hypothetical protein